MLRCVAKRAWHLGHLMVTLKMISGPDEAKPRAFAVGVLVSNFIAIAGSWCWLLVRPLPLAMEAAVKWQSGGLAGVGAVGGRGFRDFEGGGAGEAGQTGGGFIQGVHGPIP